jgi:rubrerythrin
MKKTQLSALIDLAIAREESAIAFYTGLRDKGADREGKDTLEFLADEERKHREFLILYKRGELPSGTLKFATAVNYRVAEHEKEPDPEKAESLQDLFLIAAHRERRAHEFYRTLADAHPEGPVREMLLMMASQELKHKEKMEYLHANTAYPQTAGG